MNWFVIIAMAILTLLFVFFGFRLTGLGPLSWWIAGVSLSMVLLYPLVWYGVLPEFLDQIIRWIVHIDLGFISLMFAFIILRDLIFLPLRFLFPKNFAFMFSLPTTMAMLGVSGVLLIFGYWNAQRSPAIVEVDVTIRNLPAGLENYKILQISDLHAGPGIDQTYLEGVVKQALEIKSDVIVLTGDIADGNFDIYQDRVASLALLAKNTPVLYVTGNHEYLKDSTRWISEFERLGAKLLLNEHVVLSKNSGTLLFAGVTDPTASEVDESLVPSISKALEGAVPSDVKILLAHQPNIAEEASANFDLQLSGHTHAGQFFPWSIIIKILQPYSKGLKRCDGMWVYTNPGTGHWGPPFRIGTRAEITVLTLKKVNP